MKLSALKYVEHFQYTRHHIKISTVLSICRRVVHGGSNGFEGLRSRLGLLPRRSARNFSDKSTSTVPNNDGMPRIKTAPSAVPTARKPVHYHLLLRPILQRRFARSSLWTFVVCCIVSFLIGDRYGARLLFTTLI
jgi:hypothetical protein